MWFCCLCCEIVLQRRDINRARIFLTEAEFFKYLQKIGNLPEAVKIYIRQRNFDDKGNVASTVISDLKAAMSQGKVDLKELVSSLQSQGKDDLVSRAVHIHFELPIDNRRGPAEFIRFEIQLLLLENREHFLVDAAYAEPDDAQIALKDETVGAESFLVYN